MPSSPTPVTVESCAPSPVGLSGVWTAFGRAAVSQCHPRMLFALLLPFLIIFFGGIVLLWLFWTPLTGWLTVQAEDWGVVRTVDQWLLAIGLFSIKLWLVPVLAGVILLPIAGIFGVAVAAVFVMPMVLKHVAGRDYPTLARLGRHATAVSVWNAVWVMTVFALGWLFTLPLWLLPPLGAALSVFWWTFAFSRMMRVDAIVEHATPDERRVLIARHNGGFWMLGLLCSVLNLLPPAWIVLPVFSALLFAHYGLAALQKARLSQPAPLVLVAVSSTRV